MQRISAKMEQWVKRLVMGKKRFLTEEVDSIRALMLIRPQLSTDEAINLNSKERKQILQNFAETEAHRGVESASSVEDCPVRVAPSLIKDAGEGVFATRTMPAGTVMCLFPGTVFRPDDVYEAVHDPGCPLYNRIFKQDLAHCVSLYDGSVIDAGKESEGEWTPHPFAVAHKCNHPDKGQQPNVMKLPFLWRPTVKVNAFTTAFDEPEEEEEEEMERNEKEVAKQMPIRELTAEEQGPNVSGISRFWMFGWGGALKREEAKASALRRQKLEEGRDGKRKERKLPKWDFSTTYSPTADERAVIRGLAFLSTREIHAGEELLMNYRLNPKSINKRPAWYHPVDEEEDASRWNVSLDNKNNK